MYKILKDDYMLIIVIESVSRTSFTELFSFIRIALVLRVFINEKVTAK